jgi:hypothetical protein
MPTNRTPTSRPRRPAAPDDVIELFRRLENMSPRRRNTAPFLDEDFRLHRLLGLYSERRCSICSVFDRGTAPPWPLPEFPAHRDWHKVRAVRLELLESAKGADNIHTP